MLHVCEQRRHWRDCADAQARLVAYAISPLQIGFTKKACTSDHMFVVRKLYACFIDFHKAFDRIFHTLMLYKLRIVGVSGIFYNVVKNMYVNNNLCVKMKSGFTYLFPSTLGVRQVIH